MFVHHVSTPQSRAEAWDRALQPSRIDRVELAARGFGAVAHDVLLRAAKSRTASFVAGASVMVLGSVQDFQLPL